MKRHSISLRLIMKLNISIAMSKILDIKTLLRMIIGLFWMTLNAVSIVKRGIISGIGCHGISDFNRD